MQLYLSHGFDSTLEVAAAAGLHESTIHRAIGQSRGTSDDTCARIADALNQRAAALSIHLLSATAENVRQVLKSSKPFVSGRGKRRAASS